MVDDAEYSDERTAKLSDSELSPKSRRSFLGALLAVGGPFVGALLSVPLVRFALFPLLRSHHRTQRVVRGSVDRVFVRDRARDAHHSD